MQRARRRKLLRQAKRDPMFVEAIKTRDRLRHATYSEANRAARGQMLKTSSGPARARLAEAIDSVQADTR